MKFTIMKHINKNNNILSENPIKKSGTLFVFSIIGSKTADIPTVIKYAKILIINNKSLFLDLIVINIIFFDKLIIMPVRKHRRTF